MEVVIVKAEVLYVSVVVALWEGGVVCRAVVGNILIFYTCFLASVVLRCTLVIMKSSK